MAWIEAERDEEAERKNKKQIGCFKVILLVELTAGAFF